ncbi:uncharacterized protein BDZ99DRAFT_504129 [Mytilinidion resinicola]|uniref:Uncharacterized protein n=1 Tax=Mytilinidion resinicola TaxID=574789 RepID=A0A6A6XZY6_9PEZI|nr:uncharacterized protein BDZ99DRAFT_504129 [Mytilinidion resinicola]KAF2802121.1 hypothetical protein BDZ99DRAFT_504129 [Mytilinidion resinicola]
MQNQYQYNQAPPSLRCESMKEIERASHRLGWDDTERIPKTELLSGLIHPLFRRENWSFGIDETSLFDDKGFWISLLALSVGPDDEYVKYYTTEESPDAKDKVQAVFEEMTENMHFTFGTTCADSKKMGPWGVTYDNAATAKFTMLTFPEHLSRVTKPFTIRSRKNNYTTPLVALHFRYRELFSWTAMEFSELPEGDKLKKQFKIACTLVHETAHAFVKTARGKARPEPKVLKLDTVAEVGRSWEGYLFGASPDIFCEWNSNAAKTSVLVARENRANAESPNHNVARTIYIPLPWIKRWFLEITWDNFRELRANGDLDLKSQLRDPILADYMIPGHYPDKKSQVVVLEHGKEVAVTSGWLDDSSSRITWKKNNGCSRYAYKVWPDGTRFIFLQQNTRISRRVIKLDGSTEVIF